MVDSLTAVVRGALMKVLMGNIPTSVKIDISERAARRHYGLDLWQEFDTDEHDISRRYRPFEQPSVVTILLTIQYIEYGVIVKVTMNSA